MEKTVFLKKIGEYRQRKQKLINNTFIWVSISIVSLDTISKNEKFLKQKRFEVPSKIKGKTIRRKPDDLIKILKSAQEEELYHSTYIFIAQFEAYLSDVIYLNLLYDKRKLHMNVSGGQSNKKIDVSDILHCDNHEDILTLIIEKQLGDLFYAGPKKQIEYIENVLNINIEEDIWDKWIEYKATRDLLVHNSGIINNIYLEKVKDLARGSLNEKIVMDKEYFENSLSDIKSFIGIIETRIRTEINKN